MPRENLLEFFQPPLQPVELQLVNFVIVGRNLRRLEQGRQRGQQLRQARVGHHHVRQRGGRTRGADLQPQLQPVSIVFLPVPRRGIARRGLHLPVVLQPVEKHPGLHRLARHIRRRSRRGRKHGRRTRGRGRRGCSRRGNRLAGRQHQCGQHAHHRSNLVAAVCDRRCLYLRIGPTVTDRRYNHRIFRLADKPSETAHSAMSSADASSVQPNRKFLRDARPFHGIFPARSRAVAQLGRALEWGSRGPGFKSRQPDSECRRLP